MNRLTAIGQRMKLRIGGRVALFIEGPVLADHLDIELLSGGEIDLFVSDNFVINKTTKLGDAMRPSQVRIYVGGVGNVLLGDEANTFVGNLYAPKASVLADPELEVYGSIFANNVIGSRLVVHYDRAILDAGKDCPKDPPKTCDSCTDCTMGQVCGNTGMCQGCTTDAECCAPLVCDQATRTCGPLVL